MKFSSRTFFWIVFYVIIYEDTLIKSCGIAAYAEYATYANYIAENADYITTYGILSWWFVLQYILHVKWYFCLLNPIHFLLLFT